MISRQCFLVSAMTDRRDQKQCTANQLPMCLCHQAVLALVYR